MRHKSEMNGGYQSKTRRTVLCSVGAGIGLGVFGSTAGRAGETNYWTVVALPDTQKYAERKTPYPRDQTQWIADNKDAESIVFVSHEGDVVEHGDNDEEWKHMDDAMSPLDGTVPYSTLPGNHDWATLGDKSSSIENYKQYFGSSRYEGREWFGGAGPSNGDPNRDGLNTYQLFSAGGYEFLHLALEWEPSGNVNDPSTPLGWAQSILDQYPARATIITTHEYLAANGNRTSTGERVFEKLITQNPQVFLVLCGHKHDEARQISTNNAGLKVYEILANYQRRSNGGQGLLRRIEFHPGGGSDGNDRIQIRTFSPSTGEFETDSSSQFSFGLDFDKRLRVFPAGTQCITFQDGTAGYEGTVDTGLREAEPETKLGDAQTITVDGDDPQGSGNASQLLLRFDEIVKTGDGQIPLGADIRSAALRIKTIDGGDGAALHRMLASWAENDTWASMDGGVQADGVEAASEAATQIGPVSAGSVTLDVSESIQRWVNDPLTENYGWVFRPLGDDGWDIATAESDSPPTLRVWYVPPETLVGDANGDDEINSQDVTCIQRHIAKEDVDINEDAADIDGDGDIDIGDAVAVRNISEDNS